MQSKRQAEPAGGCPLDGGVGPHGARSSGRGQLPLRTGSPLLRGEVNQVNGWVFDIGIGIVADQRRCQALLEFPISRSGSRVRDEIVAKEQGIALIGSPRLTDVDIDAALPAWLHEEEFGPVALRSSVPGRHVVTLNLWKLNEAELAQPLGDISVELCNRDLEIDDIFGTQQP